MIEHFYLYKTILVVVIFAITLAIAAYSTYAERKVAAFLQDRIGPDRAGKFGLLQPLADGLKFVEAVEPVRAGEIGWDSAEKPRLLGP